MSIVLDFSLMWDFFSSFITLFFVLLAWHLIAEYPLQGDFLAINKSPSGRPYNGVENAAEAHPNWFNFMLSHCYVQAAGVFLITMSFWAMIFVFATHYMIDCRRCNGKLTDTQEQGLYILVLAGVALASTLADYGFLEFIEKLL